MTATEQKRYGVVRDDGTVTEYPSERAAERAGRLEAQVVLAEDGSWVYPATGRTFHPSDVAGLSPSTASADIEETLRRVPGKRTVTSDRHPSNHDLMVSRLQAPKTEGWPLLASRIMVALPNLPGVTEIELTGDEPMYNYFFFKVIRRRK